MTRIREAQLDLSREPLVRPFGFKGAAFTEKWLAQVRLTGERGHTGEDLAGFAVLWSDAKVFLTHTEVGGNVLMATVLEHALTLARGAEFGSPPDLLDALIEPVHAFAQRVTMMPSLRRTFTLNALVGLDHAAWRLYAAERHLATFDDLVPTHVAAALAHRHNLLGRIPLLTYNVDLNEVRSLVDAGHFILKIKLGSPGEAAAMLEADLHHLKKIHRAVGNAETSYTDDGRIRYYLDANGRYPDREWLNQLMDGIDRLGMRQQVMILEEPFPEECHDPVNDLGVSVAVDESLHSVHDVRERVALGYTAIALKPAGKSLSLTLAMAAEAHRLGISCFVADSACTPATMDWNRQIAARLPPLPGLRMGCLESNGDQHYRRWEQMLREYPTAGATWLEPRKGVFHLDDTFYASPVPQNSSPMPNVRQAEPISVTAASDAVSRNNYA